MHMYANMTSNLKVEITKKAHYFRSISELKGCKHGGYLEGTIKIPKNAQKIELSLIPENSSGGKKLNFRYDDSFVQQLVRDTHCNLLYLSSSSSNHRPNLSQLNETAWRVCFARVENQMVLSRVNHTYLGNEPLTQQIWNDSESALLLGSKGLRVTIVKPLFKEKKVNRPGIYVSDVLKKSFEERVNELIRFSDAEKIELLSKFEEYEIEAEEETGQEFYLIKGGGMYKGHLKINCSLDDGTNITSISPLIIASNKYAIEVERIHQNQILKSGICQSFFVAFKKCEPTLKMGIKAGFKFVPTNESIELIPDVSELIRVIECRRMCKGYGLEVAFQTLPDFANHFDENEMKMFLVLKVFEKLNQEFDSEACLFMQEYEIMKFIEHKCDFHQILRNNIPGHREVFSKFLLGHNDEDPLPCGLCISHVLPTILNLTKKNNSKAEDDIEVQSLTDEDLSTLYEKIFVQFFQSVDNAAKRPRLESRNDRLETGRINPPPDALLISDAEINDILMQEGWVNPINLESIPIQETDIIFETLTTSENVTQEQNFEIDSSQNTVRHVLESGTMVRLGNIEIQNANVDRRIDAQSKDSISNDHFSLQILQDENIADDSSQNENEKVELRSSLKAVRNKIDGCLIQFHHQYPTIYDWMSLAFYFCTSTVFMIMLFSVLLYHFLIDCDD